MLEEDNIREDSKYWNITQLAAKCTAKRMVPDYISEKIMKKLKVDKFGEGHCFPCMGCRSFLTPYNDPENDNKPKYYGRFNQGVVTLNLVDVACSSGKDMDKFWKILDERLELCKRALMCRHYRLKVLHQMLHQFSGRMVHLQDLRRAKLLISFFMVDILLFL